MEVCLRSRMKNTCGIPKSHWTNIVPCTATLPRPGRQSLNTPCTAAPELSPSEFLHAAQEFDAFCRRSFAQDKKVRHVLLEHTNELERCNCCAGVAKCLGLGKAKIIRLPARMMLFTLKRPMTYYPLAEALTCSPCEYLTLETLILSRNFKTPQFGFTKLGVKRDHTGQEMSRKTRDCTGARLERDFTGVHRRYVAMRGKQKRSKASGSQERVRRHLQLQGFPETE